MPTDDSTTLVEFNLSMKHASTAYLLPGQGVQSVGMGKDLYDGSPAAKKTFQEIDDSLGRPLSKLLFSGNESDLMATINAQPAIMAVSLASFSAVQERLGSSGMPDAAYVAGHSLGEYTALAIAGVLSVRDTAQLVQERGRLMQEACDNQPGTMAAVLGLDQFTVERIARETGTYLSNVNTPQQIVISGDAVAVSQALDLASDMGAKKLIRLQVAGAFHSALMAPAESGLSNAINKFTFNDSIIPIVANCTGKPISSAEDVKAELVAQISSCVQWNASMDYMIKSGITHFIEIGPGKALSSMTKRIDRSVETTSVGDLEGVIHFKNTRHP